VDAGGLGGDEQRLADLPVGAALGDQREHLGLAAGESEGCGRRLWRLRLRNRFDLLLEAEAAALGEQLDLTAQRFRPKCDRRPVGAADCFLGLLAGSASGQECFGLPEARIGGLKRVLQPLPGRGRRLPPLGVGSSFQPGLLSPGKQQLTGDPRIAALGRGCAGKAV
jgi:hypothetical protein